MLRILLALALFSAIPGTALGQTESPDALGNPRDGSSGRSVPPPPSDLPSPTSTARTLTLEGEAPMPPGVAGRLRLLSSSLDGLAIRGSSNIGDGITSLVSAGVGFAFGTLAKNHGDMRTAKYLYVFGAVGIAQAGIAFARPRATGYASRFSVMPMTTPEEVLARLEYGERSLHHLARVHRALRFADAGLAIGASLGTLPLLLGNDGFDTADEWDWVIVVSAGLSATMGIVSLIQRSDAERRWNTYCALTDEMAEPQTARLRLEGVAPYVTQNGFGTAALFSF